MKRNLFLGLLLFGAAVCLIVCLTLIGIDQYDNWDKLRTSKQFFDDHIPAGLWGIGCLLCCFVFVNSVPDED